MSEQDTIILDDDRPGKIPNRPLTYSELVELKLHVRDTLSHLSALKGFLETYDIVDTFEDQTVILMDAEQLCNEITLFCQDKLKKMDAKKSRMR